MKIAFAAMVLFFAVLPLPRPAAAEDPAPAAVDLDRVREGTAAPDFSLLSRTGERVTLSGYRENKNIILIFYRGYW